MIQISKIILITKEPNKQAENLMHEELFDIKKNTFSQFFGRALLGRECDYRSFFNEKNFLWMHAKGSKCHGDPRNDGHLAIKEVIKTGKYRFAVTFGLHASKIFLSNSQANLAYISKIMSNGIVIMKDLPRAHVNKFYNVDVNVMMFPHVSGQCQQYWKQYADIFSHCLNLTQEEVLKIIKN